MRLRNIFAPLLALILVTGCMTKEEKAAAHEKAKIENAERVKKERAAFVQDSLSKAAEEKAYLADNTLRAKDYTIEGVQFSEFRSKGDPNSITIVAHGAEATIGVTTFKTNSKKYAEPRLIGAFKAAGINGFEFQPASDSAVVCTFVYESASADLHDMAINMKHVNIKTGALTSIRKGPLQ
jgi:hypothetical protein